MIIPMADVIGAVTMPPSIADGALWLGVRTRTSALALAGNLTLDGSRHGRPCMTCGATDSISLDPLMALPPSLNKWFSFGTLFSFGTPPLAVLRLPCTNFVRTRALLLRRCKAARVPWALIRIGTAFRWAGLSGAVPSILRVTPTVILPPKRMAGRILSPRLMLRQAMSLATIGFRADGIDAVSTTGMCRLTRTCVRLWPSI